MTENLKTPEPETGEPAVSGPPRPVAPASGESESAPGVYEPETERPDSEAADEYDSAPAGWSGPEPEGEDRADPAESTGQTRAVPVRMFDYEYNIMSDKPRLVEILASAVDGEARRLKAANASFNRGAFNWPVQVAFKLALDRYYAQRALDDCRRELEDCRRELETLAARVERDAEKLAELIENGLDRSGD